MIRSVALRTFVVLSSLALAACGPSDSAVGGAGGGKGTDAGSTGGGAGGGAGGGNACSGFIEVCNGADDDCDGFVDEGFDQDADGVTDCGGDCSDTDATRFPGAIETANQKDDDCDGKVDNRIPNADFDGDGYNYQGATAADCNDEEALVGPGAIEVGGDSVDNNCNGQVDEALPASCDGTAVATGAADFAKAMDICGGITYSNFNSAVNVGARSIRPSFGSGTLFQKKAGTRMAMLSSGKAVDRVAASPLGDSAYLPERGMDYQSGCFSATCDLTELELQIKVPQNAKSFSFDFAFFSAEFPEYVASGYNDKFEAILTSQALTSKLVSGTEQFPTTTCVGGATGCRRGNVSFDGAGQAVSVDNNYFLLCKKETSGTATANKTSKCTATSDAQLTTMIGGTGYEQLKASTTGDGATRPIGGSTGWLSTKAPVKPGETIRLTFRIYDNSDAILDSSVLIDNFKWEATSVTAPSTSPIN